MAILKTILCGVSLLLVEFAPAGAHGANFVRPGAKGAKFALNDGDRVVFLGNTLIERAQRFGDWEATLTAAFPKRKILFRNLGWDGDTVWAESRGIFDSAAKGYDRMLKRVAGIKPTVIFLGYGNNEAYTGIDALPRFLSQYAKLMDDLTEVSARGVRFVIIAPVVQMALGPPLPDPSRYNKVVEAYTAALKRLALRRGCRFVQFNANVRVAEFGYREVRKGKYANNHTDYRNKWTMNGLYWREGAYQSFAGTLAVNLLDAQAMWAAVVNIDGSLKSAAGVHAEVSKNRTGVTVELTPKEYQRTSLLIALHGVKSGEWELRHNGKALARATAGKHGVLFTLHKGPHFAHAEKFRQAIIAKNRLYFHSWRPQNVTYLFLFRKHEQGQNAKEVKEFLNLVAEKEKEIDRLKKPLTATYEIVRLNEAKK